MAETADKANQFTLLLCECMNLVILFNFDLALAFLRCMEIHLNQFEKWNFEPNHRNKMKFSIRQSGSEYTVQSINFL